MSTDGDLSKASGTDDGPDEFDSIVFDEHFIRGGVSEASLRRYQVVSERKWERPLPSTGPFSTGTSSDTRLTGPEATTPAWPGQGAVGDGPNTHPGSGGRFFAKGSGSGKPRSTGLLVGAAALVVALIVLTGLIRLGRGSAGSTGTGNLAMAAQAGAGEGQTVPLSASVPPGSCFNLPADSTAADMTITVVACAARHQYELIDMQRGTGGNNQYPTQATWSTTVNGQCSNDLQTYTGQTSSNWTGGLYPAVIPPTQDAWAKGERTIYCVAGLQPAAAGSVRGRGLAGAGPTR